ncbi:MAG TPA: histidine kinase, partial [Conexibacter sp.]|nr:histidine kinase [Conexibacter sp.]
MRRLLGSRLEIAFTAGLLAWAVLEALLIPSGWPAWERLTFALLATVPLAVRHRWPFLVLAWASAVLVLDGLVTFLPYTAVTPLPGMGVGLFAVAAYGRPRRRAVIVVAVTLVAMPPLFALSEQEVAATLHDVIVFVVMLLLALSAGWAVRTRREEAEHAAALATSSGAAHARRLRRDVEAERRRIARELHAIVTRDLSAIARLAHEARSQLGGDEQRALSALGAISRTTTAALDELRRLLHVLRAEGGAAQRGGGGPVAAAMASAPPVRSSPALAVAAARERGWSVALAERGPALERVAGRAPAELAAGRILEELLSGPGDGGEAVVAVRRRADGVAVALCGRGRRPAPLRDPARLASAQERARLHGGTLRTRRGLRGWRVEVALPLSDATSAAPSEPSALPARAVDALIAGLALGALAVEQIDRGRGAGGWISGVVLIVLPLLLLRRRAPFAAACVLALGGFCLRNEAGWMPHAGLTLVAVIVF